MSAPHKNESGVQFFYVDVSTLSPVNTTYQLRVSRMDDFVAPGLQGRGRGVRDCPPSQALGVMVLGGGGSFSAPQDREPFSFNTTAAQPQVRPPCHCLSGEEMGRLELGGEGGQQSLPRGVSGWLYSPWRIL